MLVGIDFGTTNTVAALVRDGEMRTVRYRPPGLDETDSFRTLLCFWQDSTVLEHAAGPEAIAAYLDDPLDRRLIMSMKTYLAQRSFIETQVFGRRHTLEGLVAQFLDHLAARADVDLRRARIVAGRPVRFAGESADDAFGEARLRAAFARAGFPDIDVALEPEAAGYRFARGLGGPATVLVGDFGGGTSDFSVLRFAPGTPHPVTALGQAGVGIAGDSFDFRIIDHVVSPLLGKDTTYQPFGNALPVPAEWYAAFARWHRLSLMRTPRTLRDIAEVARHASHPERLAHLVRIIEDGVGYPLYQAVSGAKAALSASAATTLRFRHEGLVIEQEISRATFEGWIAPDLRRLEGAVDQALVAARVTQEQIDRVFLTGGTSFVPAVRALFSRRFGAERVSGGGEFVSVAEGLALIGQDRLGGG